MEKIKEVSGSVRYSSGSNIEFKTLEDLVELIKNDSGNLPEYVFVYSLSDEGKTYQLVLDFNSFSRQNIDIATIKLKKYQKFLGDILLEKNLITSEKLKSALIMRDASPYGERLGEILVRLGYVTSDQIIEALNDQLGLK